MAHVTTYRVRDERGMRFLVFKRVHNETTPSTGRCRKVFSFELETGESGSFVDTETFVLTRTGERFARIRRKSRATSQSCELAAAR